MNVQLIGTCFLITASEQGCFFLASASSDWPSQSLRANRLVMCPWLGLQPAHLAKDQTDNCADSEEIHLMSESLKGKRLNTQHKSE